MTLEDLTADLEAAHDDLADRSVDLDRESQLELAMLVAALDLEDPDQLVARAIHMLFQSTAETGKLDFHLRSRYDVTYDEYLSGMSYEDMPGMGEYQSSSEEDVRRYQF
jgi:hypothetical protein